MNIVVFAGNLGADPELRTTPSGIVVCNLRIASSERVKKGGDWVDHTEWLSVVLFGKRAEFMGSNLMKGDKVLVRGPLRQTSYEDREGVKRWRTEVLADDIEPMTSLKGRGRQQSNRPSDDDIPY